MTKLEASAGRMSSVIKRYGLSWQLVRYIHLNPVRAKMVKWLGDWPWSGHGNTWARTSEG